MDYNDDGMINIGGGGRRGGATAVTEETTESSSKKIDAAATTTIDVNIDSSSTTTTENLAIAVISGDYYECNVGSSISPTTTAASNNLLMKPRKKSKTQQKKIVSSTTTIAPPIVLKKDKKWMKFYQLLHQFQLENNGNTCVPRAQNYNKQLGSWVKRQRSNYKIRKLSPERIQLLNDINFCWYKQIPWDEMYDKLAHYKTKYGTTRVTQKKELELFPTTTTSCTTTSIATAPEHHQYSTLTTTGDDDSTTIGKTIEYDQQYDDSIMKEENMNSMRSNNTIGDIAIDDTPTTASKTTMMNGNDVTQHIVDVVQSYEQEKQRLEQSISSAAAPTSPLRLWIFRQRSLYHNGKLSRDRINKLNSIEFLWDGNANDN